MKALVTSGLALLVVAATASATPLPDPPFSGGGFVAPSSAVLKQEEAVNKVLLTYLKRRATCDWVALTALQLAYTPVNEHKVEAVQLNWSACTGYAAEWYARHRDKVLEKGTPACLDQAGIDAQRAALDASAGSVSSQIFCDGGGAAPDPATGLNVPDEKRETIGETNLAKVAVKVRHLASKCYTKAASLALRSGGVLENRDAEKVQSCLDRVSRHIDDTVEDLDQTQKLPTCLSPGAAEAALEEAKGFSGSSTAAIYCAE